MNDTNQLINPTNFFFMFEKKAHWHRIAEHLNELDYKANNIAVVNVNGKKICVGRHLEHAFAFAYKCPHAGGIMADGFIDSLGNVVCPLHRYKYDMKNGRNTTGEGYYLKNWPLEIREDGVYVSMEKTSFF